MHWRPQIKKLAWVKHEIAASDYYFIACLIKFCVRLRAFSFSSNNNNNINRIRIENDSLIIVTIVVWSTIITFFLNHYINNRRLSAGLKKIWTEKYSVQSIIIYFRSGKTEWTSTLLSDVNEPENSSSELLLIVKTVLKKNEKSTELESVNLLHAFFLFPAAPPPLKIKIVKRTEEPHLPCHKIPNNLNLRQCANFY